MHSGDRGRGLMELLGVGWRKVLPTVVPQEPPKSSFAAAAPLRIPQDKVYPVAFLPSDSVALLDWSDFLAFRSLLLKYDFFYVVNSVWGTIKSQRES